MKYFLILLSLLLLFILGFCTWDITTNSSKFLSANIYPFFIKNKLTVDYGTLKPNDFEIYFSGHDGSTEYKNKLIHRTSDIPFVYGENDWVIKYKGNQQCEFRHFKTNRRYTHTYMFVIYEKQDTIYCAVNIQGQNKLKDTFYFTDIENKKTEK